MRLKNGLSQLRFAEEKQLEDKQWQLYLTRYAWMNEKTYVPFENFLTKPKTASKINTKPRDSILQKIARIKEGFDKKGD
jgi:hypothetical protein